MAFRPDPPVLLAVLVGLTAFTEISLAIDIPFKTITAAWFFNAATGFDAFRR
jgi:hypothetical protein